MNAQIESARAHPAAVISLVVAGLAVTACALVAIAYMLGWVPAGPQLPSAPTSMASPGQQVAGSAPDVALLPGETLVAPADAPAAMALPSAAPEPARPSPAPRRPHYTRSELAPSTSERSSRDVCVNCGVVASIGSSGYDWEVRVRFEDGSSETLRYPDRPPLRVGARVHLEDGRILPD